MTAKIVVNVILIKSGNTKGKTTNFIAKSKDLWAMSINPKAPPIKRTTSPKALARKIRMGCPFWPAKIEVTKARRGKKKRNPAVGP